MDFDNEEQLMSYFRYYVTYYKSTDNWDLVPHQVMSHGFMEWRKMVCDNFPAMRWRGIEVEERDGQFFDDYMPVMFARFWIGLTQEGLDLTNEERNYLLEEGWKAYLKD